MAKLAFGMNLSLDGYVEDQAFAPRRELFHHWIQQVRGLAGSAYGRLYEVMRYWDEDQPDWGEDEHAHLLRSAGEAFRSQPLRQCFIIDPRAPRSQRMSWLDVDPGHRGTWAAAVIWVDTWIETDS